MILVPIIAFSMLLNPILNTVKRSRPGSKVMRHSKTRETPFPMYVGLKLHADAKLKQLMSVFGKLGISISYQRERDINKAFAIRISERIKKDGIVATNTRKKVFTTLDLDNIDQKKKSNLSKDEFHGTLISVTNNLTHENQGELQ